MEGASFLRAGGRAGRCQEAGGGLPGSALPGAVLRAGGRNGVFVRLEGRRQARGRSSRLDGKGVEMIFGTQAGWCGGKPRSGRCLTGLSFLLEAAAGGLVRLEGLKPAALTSGPEGRRWIWPSRGRHCAIRHLLAGGTNEDAHAPTTTPSPAGRSASSSEALPFLPDRSAPERALRCGVAVDGGCAAVGWWSRIGDGAAVWSRPVGCGKGCPG